MTYRHIPHWTLLPLFILLVFSPTIYATPDGDSMQSQGIAFVGRQWIPWQIGKVTHVTYRGEEALHVRGRQDSSLFIPGVEFENGTIEMDLAVSSRAVAGIGFRGRSDGHWRNRILFNYWPRRKTQSAEFLEQAVVTRRTGTVVVSCGGWVLLQGEFSLVHARDFSCVPDAVSYCCRTALGHLDRSGLC